MSTRRKGKRKATGPETSAAPKRGKTFDGKEEKTTGVIKAADVLMRGLAPAKPLCTDTKCDASIASVCTRCLKGETDPQPWFCNECGTCLNTSGFNVRCFKCSFKSAVKAKNPTQQICDLCHGKDDVRSDQDGDYVCGTCRTSLKRMGDKPSVPVVKSCHECGKLMAVEGLTDTLTKFGVRLVCGPCILSNPYVECLVCRSIQRVGHGKCLKNTHDYQALVRCTPNSKISRTVAETLARAVIGVVDEGKDKTTEARAAWLKLCALPGGHETTFRMFQAAYDQQLENVTDIQSRVNDVRFNIEVIRCEPCYSQHYSAMTELDGITDDDNKDSYASSLDEAIVEAAVATD